MQYRIRCSRGNEIWYAYNGLEMDGDKAKGEIESCRKVHTDVHFVLEEVKSTVVYSENKDNSV